MMSNIANCGNSARNLHATVAAFFADTTKVIVDDLHNGSFCFHLTLDTPNDTVGGMSISVPPDARGDFETALLGGSGGVVHVDDLGYWDIMRFTTAEEVCAEITRVMDSICIPDAVPPSEAPEAPEDPDEIRTSADGFLYTKAQFVAFHGDDMEWNDAAVAASAPAVAASAPAVAASAHDDASSSSDDE